MKTMWRRFINRMQAARTAKQRRKVQQGINSTGRMVVNDTVRPSGTRAQVRVKMTAPVKAKMSRGRTRFACITCPQAFTSNRARKQHNHARHVVPFARISNWDIIVRKMKGYDCSKRHPA